MSNFATTRDTTGHNSRLALHPLGHALGAEVAQADLTAALDA